MHSIQSSKLFLKLLIPLYKPLINPIFDGIEAPTPKSHKGRGKGGQTKLVTFAAIINPKEEYEKPLYASASFNNVTPKSLIRLGSLIVFILIVN